MTKCEDLLERLHSFIAAVCGTSDPQDASHDRDDRRRLEAIHFRSLDELKAIKAYFAEKKRK